MDYGEYKDNRVAGIMGLGWGNSSFVNQMDKTHGRFSYCLPVIKFFTKIRPKTYLRFGDDIIQGRKASSTTITTIKGIKTYYVGLQDINMKRLHINTNVFALKIDGANGPKGGCIIDSGTPYSRIVKPTY
ncbi:hypothetical protein Sango_0921400 [Sesamum angolense]|uniref:Peptidase A1 domain-containing protein n=1 Tax=Sesamum angolense TaxID=2727404 RepID=A0AAE2BXW9_9LAMI|nr:hypothetical protein Sango_0921400 [Sesamum angolense]